MKLVVDIDVRLGYYYVDEKIILYWIYPPQVLEELLQLLLGFLNSSKYKSNFDEILLEI
ncbi:hypothetical protein Scep_001901 [Stephania cephalantha]|uniref:Uncharacterized protein n=1 Tax=Stephania cephalantha TaxID=152367 RepID=A0AAP0LBQ2_9MAGN